MRIALLGVPMYLGAGRRGMDMGPKAIRCTGLVPRLQALGYEVEDLGNIDIGEPETIEPSNPKVRYVDSICDMATEVAKRAAAIDSDVVPIFLGGDHSISLGSVAGIVQTHGQIGILWVDAHADFNTNDTTLSGNIHGMVLAALAGIGDPRLTSICGFSPKVQPSRIVILGLRVLDRGEEELLDQQKICVIPRNKIDQRNDLASVVKKALMVLTQDNKPFHVSFDIDVVDPHEAPGVSTPMLGGLTVREAHLVMELIAANKGMCSLDLVEVNPFSDHENQTGELAANLICSAFGERFF